jgi:hypothetical protein
LRYDGLGNYALQAEENGTTLQAVFASYAAFEAEFRKDPIAGAVAAWTRLGFNPELVLAELFRRVAQASQPPQPAAPVINEAMLAEFKADPRNEFAETVEPVMHQLIANGQAKTLFEAYEAACTMSPLIQEVQMNRLR